VDPIVSPRLPLVTIQTSILDTEAVIDRYRNGSALVLDEQRRRLTTNTAGDIRQAILAGDELTQPIMCLKQERKDVPPAPPSANVSRSVRPHAAEVVERKIKVVGVGAGGHAKVVIDILSYSPRVHVVGLVELATRLFGETIEGSLILGDDTLLPQLLAEGVGSAFIGIGGVGDNLPRAQAYDRILKLGFDLIAAIHPRAVVARTAKLGRGVSIMAGVVVNPAAVIGDNVILNSQCTVEHDCVIGDHVHIAPGATLSGAVQVGRLSHIGTGASIRQGVRIGERVVVGVGSVVINDVPDGMVVVGAPARPLKVVSSK
jgi:UDP-perosamine 4-acetyltransferase